MQKIFDKLNLMIASLILFLGPTAVFAAQVGTEETVKKTYSKILAGAIGAAFFDNTLLTNVLNDFLMGLFSFLFAVAIFQVIYRSYENTSFVTEIGKISFYALICLMILGKVNYTTFFPNLTSGLNTTTFGPQTLDRDVYLYLNNKFDNFADQLTEVAGLDKYDDEMRNLIGNMNTMTLALEYCGPMAANCFTKYAQAAKGLDSAHATDQKEDTSISGALQFLVRFLHEVYDFIRVLAGPFWILQVAIWLLSIFRIFMNYWALVVYALSAAVSLFFCKIFSVFLVLPDFRGRVWNAFKFPLSVSMYGAMTALIVMMSCVITRAINTAMIETLTLQIQKTNAVVGLVTNTTAMMDLMFGTVMSVIVVMLIQVLSLSKIPGLCKDLMNLSFESLVDFGRTIIEAGFGVLKTVGPTALAVAAGAATGGASLAASAMSGAKGGFSAGGVGGALSGLRSGLAEGTSGALDSGFKRYSNLSRVLGGSKVASEEESSYSGSSGTTGGSGGSGGSTPTSSGSGGGSPSTGSGGSGAGTDQPKTFTRKEKKKEQDQPLSIADMAIKTVVSGMQMGIGAGLGNGLDVAQFMQGVGNFAHHGYTQHKAHREMLENNRTTGFNSAMSTTMQNLQSPVNIEQLLDSANAISSGSATVQQMSQFRSNYTKNLAALSRKERDAVLSAQEHQSFQDYNNAIAAANRQAIDDAIIHQKDSKGNLLTDSNGDPIVKYNAAKASHFIKQAPHFNDEDLNYKNYAIDHFKKENWQHQINQLNKKISQCDADLSHAQQGIKNPRSNRIEDTHSILEVKQQLIREKEAIEKDLNSL